MRETRNICTVLHVLNVLNVTVHTTLYYAHIVTAGRGSWRLLNHSNWTFRIFLQASVNKIGIRNSILKVWESNWEDTNNGLERWVAYF